ncbi:hypothetical protein Hanom_Chr04g00310741 [Helianthus anomalus]
MVENQHDSRSELETKRLKVSGPIYNFAEDGGSSMFDTTTERNLKIVEDVSNKEIKFHISKCEI